MTVNTRETSIQHNDETSDHWDNTLVNDLKPSLDTNLDSEIDTYPLEGIEPYCAVYTMRDHDRDESNEPSNRRLSTSRDWIIKANNFTRIQTEFLLISVVDRCCMRWIWCVVSLIDSSSSSMNILPFIHLLYNSLYLS
jgi:hypothetical protein